MSQIAAASSQCLSSFDALCAELKSKGNASGEAQLTSLDGIRCEQGRFEAWCGSFGALDDGHCSLDSRLRESAEVLSNVTMLLRELQAALAESIEILSGCRSSTGQQTRDETYGHTADAEERTEDCLTKQPCIRQTNIVEIITELCTIGSKIKNPNAKANPVDPTLYREIDPSTNVEIYSRYSEYDKQHVSELVLELRKGREDLDGTYDFIIPRLAAALTLRRKQFKCWENYSKHGGLQPSSGKSRPDIEPAAVPACRNGDLKKSTTPNPASNPAVESLENDVSLPDPPAESAHAKEFTCPYCWEKCPAKHGYPQNWRAHVIRDLQPYVCTYERCPHPYQLYGSRSQWIEHENVFHRRLWRCRKHRTSVHSSAEGLEKHFRRVHNYSFEEGKRHRLVDTSLTSFVNDRCFCPICLSPGPFDHGLEDHLAGHLERIATFALPQHVGIVESKLEEAASKSIESVQIDVYTSSTRNTELPADVLQEEPNDGESLARRLQCHFNDDQGNRLLGEVAAGNNEQVHTLLQQGVNPDAMDGDYKTALAYAAEKRFKAIARMLLEHGADPNADCFFAGTPLRFAVSSGDCDIVKMMFDHGAIARPVNNNQETHLMAAALRGDEAMVRLLAEHGIDPDARDTRFDSALSYATTIGNDSIVKFLLDKGVEVDPQDFAMRTPLFIAAGNGHKAIVNLLLNHGADPNYTDACGVSPLGHAAENGHAELVSIMLSHNASFHSTSTRISAFKYPAILKLLLANGVAPDLVDRRHCTPLHHACAESNEEIAEMLLSAGADPNATDLSHTTPLQFAISEGNLSIVHLLLSHGAHPNTPHPVTYRTPISHASENGYTDIVHLLLSAGADPHSRDCVTGSGQTPLLYAAANGHASVVQLLLARGADHSVVCARGESALVKAAKVGSFLTVVVLLCAGADPNVFDKVGRAALFYAMGAGATAAERCDAGSRATFKWIADVLRWRGARRGRVSSMVGG